jgi:hypothetical protein
LKAHSTSKIDEMASETRKYVYLSIVRLNGNHEQLSAAKKKCIESPVIIFMSAERERERDISTIPK